MAFSLFIKVSLTKKSLMNGWTGVPVQVYVRDQFFIFCSPRKIALLSAVLRSRRFAAQIRSTKIMPISVSERPALCKSFHVCQGPF